MYKKKKHIYDLKSEPYLLQIDNHNPGESSICAKKLIHFGQIYLRRTVNLHDTNRLNIYII